MLSQMTTDLTLIVPEYPGIDHGHFARNGTGYSRQLPIKGEVFHGREKDVLFCSEQGDQGAG